MTKFQKTIKYIAVALAIFLSVSIIGGILGAIGLIDGFIFADAVEDNMKAYSITGEILDVKISVNAADVHIKEGATLSVESNLKHLKVEQKGSSLVIEETKKFFRNYKNASLTIYIPADMSFHSIKLTTGAGRLTAACLTAELIDFEFGAGEVDIASLTATKSADIEGGAGRITISDGALNNLDLEMGVGRLSLSAILTGDCKLDLGIGESDITLIGDKNDYKLDLNKGIGSITVDGESTNHYGGNGTNKVEINGGIGTIHVLFKEANIH